MLRAVGAHIAPAVLLTTERKELTVPKPHVVEHAPHADQSERTHDGVGAGVGTGVGASVGAAVGAGVGAVVSTSIAPGGSCATLLIAE